MRSAKGSSWALVCSAVLVSVLLSSASEESPRRISMMQEQADLTDLLNPIEMQNPWSMVQQEDYSTNHRLRAFAGQVLVSDYDNGPISFPKGSQQELPHPPSLSQREADLTGNLNSPGDPRPEVFPPRRGQPVVGPRSFPVGPLISPYPVDFPLGQPTSDNVQAICLHGDHRPRYPESYFPPSGFSKLKRMATAVNNAEAWFSMCCTRNQTWTTNTVLCCATQAWRLSADLFCEEDSQVKDILYHCCKKRGSERQKCFHEDAQNPNYGPTEELPVMSVPSTSSFSFDPSTCSRGVMTPYSARTNRRKAERKQATSQKVDINFPLGQPTADNIASLCGTQKLRPRYSTKCLPRSGYELVAHQAKSINRMEKGFKLCCRKKQGVLDCAEQTWRLEVDKFCSTVNGVQIEFPCCLALDRYTCFKLNPPDPHYNMTSATEELSLTKICDTHNIIKKRFPVGFPLKTFVSQCCPLPEQDKASCSEQQMKEISQNVCSSKQTSPPAVRHCCKMTSKEERPQCVSKIVMDAITKATNVLRQKKRKRCPLS